MTSNAPHSAPVVPPFVRPRHPHQALLAAGISQLVLTALAGLGYSLVGIGVGTCTDASASPGCRQVMARYNVTGWALALNALLGLITVLVVQKPRSAVTRRLLAGAFIVGMVLAGVASYALWTAAAGS